MGIGSQQRNINPVAGNQQTMRVHTVGSAGHKRQAILARRDFQLRHIIGVDHADTIHLIPQSTPQHLDIHEITLIKFVKTSEHHRVNQATMPGDHRMSALPAHRKTRAIQMPRADGNTHTLHQGGNPYQDNDCRHETAFPGTKRNDITLIAATGHTLNQKPHKTPKNQKTGHHTCEGPPPKVS